jgi:hypothetical protein
MRGGQQQFIYSKVPGGEAVATPVGGALPEETRSVLTHLMVRLIHFS